MLHLADLGFKQISIEPVVAAEDEEYHLSTDDLPEINQAYDRLAEAYIERRKQGEALISSTLWWTWSRAPVQPNVHRAVE